MNSNRGEVRKRRLPVVVVSAGLLVVGMIRMDSLDDCIMYGSLVIGGAIQANSDLLTRYMPRFVTYLMACIALVVVVARRQVISPVLAMAFLVGFVFWIIHAWRKSSLGFGDVLLAPTLALYVGWVDVLAIPLWLFIGSFCAALTAVLLRKRYLPFGPWLVGPAVVVHLAPIG